MIRRKFLAFLAGVSLVTAGLGVTTPASAATPTTPAPAVASPSAAADESNGHVNPPPGPSKSDKPTKGKAGKKHQPGTPPTPCSTTCFMYAGARVGGLGAPIAVDGASDNMGIYAPTLKQTVTVDSHTLGELAVQSTDEQQIVEVGWHVDKSVNGDLKTRLFVFKWVNGVPGCYNGCGWTDYGPETTYFAGMDLTSFLNTQKKFFVQYFNGAWWIGIDPANGTGAHWMGYFPGSLWTSPTFTKAGFIQVFGEIAANQQPTCTDMGNGVAATSTTGGVMGSFNTLTGSTWSLTAFGSTYQDTTNGYPQYSLSNYTFRYGGGGSPQAPGC